MSFNVGELGGEQAANRKLFLHRSVVKKKNKNKK
jgi:hypothetical protein